MLNSHQAAVQAEFIEAIKKHGLPYVFNWLDSWMLKAAKAELEDEFVTHFGEHAKEHDLRELTVLKDFVQTVGRSDRQSTGAGANMYARAMLTAQAEVLTEANLVLDPDQLAQRFTAARQRVGLETPST